MRGDALLLFASFWLVACQPPLVAGGVPKEERPDEDPLLLSAVPTPGSLDELHHRVIARSCAGQPGLCHAGQFEPNLSTPALTYANLVYRPSLEKPRLLRVLPGVAGASVLMQKLRGDRVATRMPLGAAPLSEEEMTLFADWIELGALRRPGAEPAPRLNNAPFAPEIAIFDDGEGDKARRLDGAGRVAVAVGSSLTLRHSVHDFETWDEDIPFAAFVLSAADGRNVVLSPGMDAPQIGPAVHDPAGPAGAAFSRSFRFTVPEKVQLMDAMGRIGEPEPAQGKTFTVIAVYLDSQPPSEGIAVLSFRQDLIQVK